MHHPAQIPLNQPQFCPRPLCRRKPPDHELVLRVRATEVREPEERECFRLPFLKLPPVGRRKAPELDQPRLLQMNLQSKLRQTFHETSQKPLGISMVLETGHKIIGLADYNDVPSRYFLAPHIDPQLEHELVIAIKSECVIGIAGIRTCPALRRLRTRGY